MATNSPRRTSGEVSRLDCPNGIHVADRVTVALTSVSKLLPEESMPLELIFLT